MIFKNTHRAFFPLPTQKVFHILIFNNDWFYFTGISPVRLIWWLIQFFSVWNISPTRLVVSGWWKNSYSLISKSGQHSCFSCLLLLIVQCRCSHTHTQNLWQKTIVKHTQFIIMSLLIIWMFNACVGKWITDIWVGSGTYLTKMSKRCLIATLSVWQYLFTDKHIVLKTTFVVYPAATVSKNTILQ